MCLSVIDRYEESNEATGQIWKYIPKQCKSQCSNTQAQYETWAANNPIMTGLDSLQGIG